MRRANRFSNTSRRSAIVNAVLLSRVLRGTSHCSTNSRYHRPSFTFIQEISPAYSEYCRHFMNFCEIHPSPRSVIVSNVVGLLKP
ncbi:hypothetical protein KCP78_16155 [Salmonella enterica subsp. enterica]|nr:hypothetical protein KCP78_16155 [Salmonella enterica subsp. enterica]